MNIAVILAGGTGSRIDSGIPKQFIEIKGKPMICFCLETFFAHEDIDGIQIVADKAWREYILRHILEIEKHFGVPKKFRGFSEPGVNRQMSIYHGLKDIREYAKDSDTVLIHDAARPFVQASQISRCFAVMEGHDGVISMLPMKDTVYMVNEGKICSLLDRTCIYAGQAPELFLLGKYYEANNALLPDRILSVNGSTEPAVMAGMDIWLAEGDEGNFKVTTGKDMELFRQIAENSFRSFPIFPYQL